MAIAGFFLIWGILYEGREEAPWIFAGISASAILIGAVLLREVILRKARNNYLRAERQLDYNLENIALRKPVKSGDFKLSLKRNSLLIDRIRTKSEAAKVLGHLPEGHWEVFELCNEYLAINEEQFQTVGVGSPRLAALRRGKGIVEALHKFHLLNWVEIETRLLTEEANNQVELSDKIELVQRSMIAVDSALEFYPDDEKLIDSKAALSDFISSIKISYWVELAEKEVFKENFKEAVSFYRDALFYLAREDVNEVEKNMIAEKINFEIERIRKLESRNLSSKK